VFSGYAYWRFLFWPQLAGTLFLLAGLILVRRQLRRNADASSALGRLFVPTALAVCGTEHLVSANFMMDMVPAWMPGRLFWAYFVGFALLAAATSILFMKRVGLSASLLGTMFVLFVVMMHLPHAVADPRDRFRWAVAFRDLAFALGAWALAATQEKGRYPKLSLGMISTCRVVFALVLLFFGVEHLLHPDFAPGVPLEQATPVWIPLRVVWGYVVGSVMLASGVSILLNVRTRIAASWLGLIVTFAVVFIYLPMLPAASQPSEINNAVNYIADTLLFAGSIFLLAASSPREAKSALDLRGMVLPKEGSLTKALFPVGTISVLAQETDSRHHLNG
jgi:uncharacterized membrane protein